MVNTSQERAKNSSFEHTVCSLINKVQDIDNFLSTDNMCFLAISETHLDNTCDDATMEIQGYSIYRKDRDIYGGGVAMYIKSVS